MEEKVKLIKFSSSAWHYKLIKLMFGRILPDPKQLKNLCPYFWMMIASLLVCPFVLPFVGIAKLGELIFNLVGNAIDVRMSRDADEWLHSLTDIQASDLFYHMYWWMRPKDEHDYEPEFYANRPKVVKKAYESDNQMLMKWAKDKGFDIDDPKIVEKLNEHFIAFEELRAKRIEEYRKRQEEIQKRNSEREEMMREKRWAREEADRKRREKMDKFFEPVAKFFDNIKKSLTISNYNQVIKAAKRITGLLFTFCIATALYFIIHALAWVVMFCVVNWNGAEVLTFVIVFGCVIGSIIVGVLLSYGLGALMKVLKKQYNEGKLSVWVRPFYYLGLGLFYVIKFSVWYPTYFIFVSFIWKIIFVSFLFGIFKGLWKGIIKFTGIFGEYFGSSYTDYCPGIEWEEEKKSKR